MIEFLYDTLQLWAIVGFLWAVGGYMNDHNNTYPIPMLVSAVVAGIAAGMLI